MTARAQLPPGVRLWSIGGRSLGVVLCARYGAGSTLEYSELIVSPGLASAHGRLGWWISAIYVDNEVARAGGISIWGLPKQLAAFDWDRRGPGVTVHAPGQATLLDVRYASRRPTSVDLPLPILAPALCGDGRIGQRFWVRGTVAARFTRSLGPETRSVLLELGRLQLSVRGPTS